MEDWKTNREKKREPKQGKFWCYGCDACLVHEVPKNVPYVVTEIPITKGSETENERLG